MVNPVLSQSLPKNITLVVEQSHDAPHIDLVGDPIVLQVIKSLDVSLDIVECPWVRCLRLLEIGQADIVDHLFYTKERATFLEYLPKPYIQRDYEFRFYSLQGASITLNQLSDLERYSISMIKGDSYFPEFDHNTDWVKYPALSHVQAIQMVLKGRIELLIASPALSHAIVQSLDVNQQLVELPFKHSVKRGVFLAVSKRSKWQAFIAQLSEAQHQVLKHRDSEE